MSRVSTLFAPVADLSALQLIARSTSDLTKEWLSAVLEKTVEMLSMGPIGSGQMCRAYLLTYVLASSKKEQKLVVKIVSLPVPVCETFLSLTLPSSQSSDHPVARKTGHVSHMYSSEVSFYHDLRDMIGDGNHVPKCYFSAVDDAGWFTVVLEVSASHTFASRTL